MIDWISLNMTPFVGPRAATKLLERFGSPENVFHARRSELESLRLRPETILSIIKREFHGKAETELARVKELGGDILVLDDGSYPQLLREIADPPIVLYVRGDWQKSLEAPCIAVIGSRRSSTYGVNASQMISRDLASRSISIISGFARGIDSAAHRGAIEAKGKTVAVLGTGIDQAYPRENSKLLVEILEAGGAVVSQFPLETPPLKENFPYRNRIISGLSLGVLIVEASERSGSLITARLATEQNREVFAVPGNITSRNSFGTNFLIKSGAKLVQQWQDVVTELPKEISSAILPPTIMKSDETSNLRAKAPSDLNDHERKIWSLLTQDSAIHIDELIEQSKLSVGEVSTALLGLEMREIIRALPGKSYARKI
jgi:DNA processing protein